MKLRVAISPCPNDTFMFDAMLNNRINTEGLEFEPVFYDIEELNLALHGTNPPHISKCSYAILPLIKNCFKLMSSGSALGNGNGPLLVASDVDTDITDFEIRVAIPGKHTTANLLLERLFPHLSRRYTYIFSDIMSVVSKGVCDAGVLIHEGRFVYQKAGLHLLADLGIEWEKRTGLPIPLGAIVISRELPDEVQQKANRVLRKSIEYAFANPEVSREFVRSKAQEMEDEVIKSHIALYVNEQSLNIDETGKRAIEALLGEDVEKLLI